MVEPESVISVPPPSQEAPARDSNRPAYPAFLAGGGEMGERMRCLDWTKTPLGAPEFWPQSLKTAVRIMLTSRQAIWIGWGPDLTYLYNDAYRSIIGGKHPHALGQPTREVWREIWHIIGPMLSVAMNGDEGTYVESQRLIMERNGYREETYYTFSYSPIPNDDESAGGIICANTDDTQRSIGARQLALLRELSVRTASARSQQEACDGIRSALATNDRDLPFALIYLSRPDSPGLTLAETCGLSHSHPAAHPGTSSTSANPWPLDLVVASREMVVLEDLPRRFAEPLPTGTGNETPARAALIPLSISGRPGVLVTGLNSFRLLDEGYRNFLNLVGGQIAASIASAEAYEDERRRAEALAELDRAKTEFFSNVSHEFRTPLTLMLGPVEDMLDRGRGDLNPAILGQLETVHRNSLRLLKLVNTMLDFSRIEAERMTANFAPVDLPAYTAELASVFRAAIERAGLKFIVDCPPLPSPARLDRDMWEKIVLNLLSNAFKFTLRGEIEVKLDLDGDQARLTVRDTGVGIPPAELPRVFDRFHRVEGSRGRTHEGTGIGLSLVRELVRLHGGTIHAESTVDQGSRFIVNIPFVREKFDSAPPFELAKLRAPTTASAAFAQEALRWSPAVEAAAPGRTGQEDAETVPGEGRPRVVWADDNADMRDYVRRLLAGKFAVTAYTDGQAALEAIRVDPPDLVLCDVMMPRLDGFGLLRALREDPTLKTIPVILLSARAGEEARVGGMEAGADDYLTKPFSARELLARVESQVKMRRLRQEAESALRESEIRFRTIVEITPECVKLVGPDGTLLHMNSAGLALVGARAAEDVVGLDVCSLIAAEDRDRFRAFNRRVCAGNTGQLEFDLVGLRGERRHMETHAVPLLNADGTVVQLAVTRDITKRKEAENALRREIEERKETHRRLLQRTAQFETLLNQAPLGVYVVDADFRIREVNPTARPVFGDIPDLVGRDFDEVIHILWPAPYADELSRRFRHTLETGESYAVPEIGENRADRSAPAKEYYEWRIDRIPLPDGRSGVVCYFRDISSQVFARQQLKLARDDALAANRAKDEFLAALSHELRTPLNPVLLVASGCAGDPTLPEAVRSHFKMIQDNVSLQARLIDDLLDLNRITRGKLVLDRRALDLHAVLHDAAATVADDIAEKGISIRFDLRARAPIVDGDPVRLRQVFWNVLKNAAKFTPARGSIEVTSIDLAPNREIEIRVRDTGIGMVPDELARVFNPFVQGRHVEDYRGTAYGGLGLGLAISHMLIDSHGGHIAAESDGPGTGTTIIVRLSRSLPGSSGMASAAPGAMHNGHPAPAAASARGHRVLFVEDHAPTRNAMTTLLRLRGHEVVVAESMADALQKSYNGSFDVLISDLGLPDGDGCTLMSELRKHLPALPGIAISGYGMDADLLRSRDAGFGEHLTKPVSIETIERALRRLFAN